MTAEQSDIKRLKTQRHTSMAMIACFVVAAGFLVLSLAMAKGATLPSLVSESFPQQVAFKYAD